MLIEKYFCVVYGLIPGKQISARATGIQRKLGVTTHILEIIKQQLF